VRSATTHRRQISFFAALCSIARPPSRAIVAPCRYELLSNN